MSEERNNSLRKFALWRTCVTPKSSRLHGSPQTPLGEVTSITNPFVPLHENLHQPFCSPETYYSAIFSYDSSVEGLQGISEENASDIEASPKQKRSVRFPVPGGTIWSPEQQALLCPVNIDDREVARQANAEARAALTCTCGSPSRSRICQIHTIEAADQAKLNLFWGCPHGLQSPASASPPSAAQLRRLQALAAASSRLNIDDDDYTTCSSSCSKENPADEVKPCEGCVSVGCQTDFQLPISPLTQAQLCASFQAAIANNHLYRAIFDTVEDKPADPPPAGASFVGIGRIDWSPPVLNDSDTAKTRDIIATASDVKRRRSRQSHDDGGLTPRRPSSFTTTPSLSLRRRSFGELDLSPIQGDWSDPSAESQDKQQTRNEQLGVAPVAIDEMSVDINASDNTCLSPITGFTEGDVMSSTYYTDSQHARTADLVEKMAELDNGYQSMAVSSSNSQLNTNTTG